MFLEDGAGEIRKWFNQIFFGSDLKNWKRTNWGRADFSKSIITKYNPHANMVYS